MLKGHHHFVLASALDVAVLKPFSCGILKVRRGELREKGDSYAHVARRKDGQAVGNQIYHSVGDNPEVKRGRCTHARAGPRALGWWLKYFLGKHGKRKRPQGQDHRRGTRHPGQDFRGSTEELELCSA